MLALRLAGVAATFGLLGFVGAALADPSSELASSPAQRCLSPALEDRVKPDYPEALYKAKVEATITAELEFSGPGRSPSVNIEGNPRSEFARAIEEYASQLRVPCMGVNDAPVKLRQTFDFVPNDGRKVAWTTPTDDANRGRHALLKCVVRPSNDEVRYPDSMARAGREGRVLVRVKYFAPDKAPSVELLYNGGDRTFASAVAGYLEQLRMPCVGSEPVEENIAFEFAMDGGGNYKRHVLKDLPLQAFLGLVKPIKTGSAFFDTNTMKCPFDVRLTFRQPFEPNKIQELEEDIAARHAFLDWLGQREIDLDRQRAGELLGQQMVIHIPCARIDL